MDCYKKNSKTYIKVCLYVNKMINKTKKDADLGRHPKGQFFKNMAYIERGMPYFLHLWSQMQCLSGKLTAMYKYGISAIRFWQRIHKQQLKKKKMHSIMLT